jgi:hypothetical protein
MTNQTISDFLRTYIENPDPRYAVMLKGKWGCGKSYFISKWVEENKQHGEDYGQNDIVLEPIKISLYGLKTTDEITKAIDRALHPILYSKGMTIAKNVLKLAGKIVLKTNFDFNDDGKDDATFTASLDSLALFGSKDEKVKGVKFLIFDDLERCQVDMKLLLGYINYFVEQCDCHVVIVGDDSKIEGNDKITLDDFKEKTVGREFYVLPDIREAVCSFVSEVPWLEWMKGQLSLIESVFVATECNNLRILRQCLYDFKVQYGLLDEKLVRKDKNVMPAMLASFIAVYCEYKGKHKKIIREWEDGTWSFLFSKDDNPEKAAVLEIERKYSLEKFNGINILNKANIKSIIAHIEGGWSMKGYIEGLLKADQAIKGVLNRLEGFREMSNEEFLHDCDEMAQELMENKHRTFYNIGKAIAFFSLFERENLYQVKQEVIEHTKDYIPQLFKVVKDKEDVYHCRNSFYQGLSNVENREGKMRIHNEMSECFKAAFEKRMKEIPDEMEKALANLSNENVKDLFVIDEKSTPDKHTSYDMIPILKMVDAKALMKKIKVLTNGNIRNFAIFLANHYKVSHNLSKEFSSLYKDDKDCLLKLKGMLEQQIKKETAVRRWAFEYLHSTVEVCIRRCEGAEGSLSRDL